MKLHQPLTLLHCWVKILYLIETLMFYELRSKKYPTDQHESPFSTDFLYDKISLDFNSIWFNVSTFSIAAMETLETLETLAT